MNRLVLALLLATSAAYAAGPSVVCSAEQRGKRTLAAVRVTHFFDREMLRLIKLGLEGRLKLKLVLVRRRSMWFDDDVQTVRHTAIVTWDKQRRLYLLDGTPVAERLLDDLPLDNIALGRRDNDTAGSHYVEVDVQLEVVTMSSMMSAARWVTGADGEVITSQLARMIVADATRSDSDSCDVEWAAR